jgi:hypothetical protein
MENSKLNRIRRKHNKNCNKLLKEFKKEKIKNNDFIIK